MADSTAKQRHTSLLADCTPVSRPLPEHFMPDRCLTDTAGLAFPVIDEEPLLEIAGLSIGIEKVSQRRATFKD